MTSKTETATQFNEVSMRYIIIDGDDSEDK